MSLLTKICKTTKKRKGAVMSSEIAGTFPEGQPRSPFICTYSKVSPSAQTLPCFVKLSIGSNAAAKTAYALVSLKELFWFVYLHQRY